MPVIVSTPTDDGSRRVCYSNNSTGVLAPSSSRASSSIRTALVPSSELTDIDESDDSPPTSPLKARQDVLAAKTKRALTAATSSAPKSTQSAHVADTSQAGPSQILSPSTPTAFRKRSFTVISSGSPHSDVDTPLKHPKKSRTSESSIEVSEIARKPKVESIEAPARKTRSRSRAAGAAADKTTQKPKPRATKQSSKKVIPTAEDSDHEGKAEAKVAKRSTGKGKVKQAKSKAYIEQSDEEPEKLEIASPVKGVSLRYILYAFTYHIM